MIVMPGNNTGGVIHYFAGKYGGIGLLIGPGGWRSPAPYLPYALDNGAYSAFATGTEWSPEPWFRLLASAAAHHTLPLWAIVPDVVANREGTLGAWHKYAPMVRERLPGCPLAFAVQNGMDADDVPADAAVVFVGGDTDWKWATLDYWVTHAKRVHVGRVNGGWRLHRCAGLGVESVDGTGWTRGGAARMEELERFLAAQSKQQVRGLDCTLAAAERAIRGARRYTRSLFDDEPAGGPGEGRGR